MDDHPYIIETEETTKKNKFPILLQLGVLMIIMLALFSHALLDRFNPDNTEETNTPIAIEELSEQPLADKQINDEDVRLTAKAAFVWDAQTQRVLYSKNADTSLPLASITKLMTALLAHELIEENKVAIVPAAAIQQEGSSGLAVGEAITIENISELALVSSSNDAAYALAASVGSLLGDRDPAAQFIAGMNVRAEELKLPTLEFWNTTGLDLSLTKPGAVGSARDVSFLMEYIVTNYPEILTPTTKQAALIYNTNGAYHEAENTNHIVDKIPNLIGSKTGFTDLAGGNLTVAFDVGLNHPVIITVLGSTREERFTDVLTLMTEVQKVVAN